MFASGFVLETQEAKEAALLEMRTENEKLDIEREAAQRLLSEMEEAGAQKAAELAALAQENESLSKERADMERLVSTAQQQQHQLTLARVLLCPGKTLQLSSHPKDSLIWRH